MARVRTRLFLDREAAMRVAMDAAEDLALKATLGTAIHAQRTVPVLTGRLRSTQRHRVRRLVTRATGQVEYIAPYAAAVHEGAKPHIITARRRRALVFEVDGRTVFTKRVRHPGNRANPWLYRALVIEAGRLNFLVTPR